jgi:hypothetical protein
VLGVVTPERQASSIDLHPRSFTFGAVLNLGLRVADRPGGLLPARTAGLGWCPLARGRSCDSESEAWHPLATLSRRVPRRAGSLRDRARGATAASCCHRRRTDRPACLSRKCPDVPPRHSGWHGKKSSLLLELLAHAHATFASCHHVPNSQTCWTTARVTVQADPRTCAQPRAGLAPF